jgi:FKBP-type peptidyl-prolyl cis-trans isomerase SlyD
MNITNNKMVTLSYTLKADDQEGELIEQTTENTPLKFVFGLGAMLPMFESNLDGMKEGDNFEMKLAAKDAYGEIDENAIVELAKDIFLIDGIFDEERFKIGSQIPMQTSNGQQLNGIVIKLDEENLTMDFNHPLAGTDLHFTGNIIEVRDATEEELAPSMGCGCGSDGCGDNGCSSDSESCGCDSGCGC